MKPVTIGGIKIDTPLCLSPMAGVSALPFRVICKQMGAGYSPTELVSARSIRYNGLEKSMQYMRIDPQCEGITAIQLFGSEDIDFTVAIEKILEDARLKDVSMIDINMGCPVPKVVKTGAGSALLKDPTRASGIVKACVKAVASAPRHIPITVKTRIGFEGNQKGSPDFAKALADAGCEMLCVHGRTAVQMYYGNADIDAIASMREAIVGYDIPFFANGDVCDGATAAAMLARTGADGLMVGRAARGNPWVFEQITAELDSRSYEQPTPAQRKEMLLRELEGRCQYAPENIAVREFRSVMTFYIKGLPGSAQEKVRLCAAQTVQEVREILEL